MKRRNNLDVCVDILQAASGGVNKTSLVVKSNLNFEIIKEYLQTLMFSGYLVVGEGGRYYTTEKGVKFVEDYRELVADLRFDAESSQIQEK